MLQSAQAHTYTGSLSVDVLRQPDHWELNPRLVLLPHVCTEIRNEYEMRKLKLECWWPNLLMDYLHVARVSSKWELDCLGLRSAQAASRTLMQVRKVKVLHHQDHKRAADIGMCLSCHIHAVLHNTMLSCCTLELVALGAQ